MTTFVRGMVRRACGVALSGAVAAGLVLLLLRSTGDG
jgi:hypothetical protein